MVAKNKNMDPVAQKQLVIAQLQKNSDEFLELWKEKCRFEKSQNLANRQRVLNALQAGETKKNLKRSAPVDLPLGLLQQIRAREGQQLEEWKEQKNAQKVHLLRAKSQVLADVKSRKIHLKATKMSYSKRRELLLASIRKEAVPAWKLAQVNNNKKMVENTIHLLREINCGEKVVLKNHGNARQMLLAAIRNHQRNPVKVEAWKEKQRCDLIKTFTEKHLVLQDLPTKTKGFLKQKQMEKTMPELRTLLMTELHSGPCMVPAWKDKELSDKSQQYSRKKKMLVDISAQNFALKTQAPHENSPHLVKQLVNQAIKNANIHLHSPKSPIEKVKGQVLSELRDETKYFTFSEFPVPEWKQFGRDTIAQQLGKRNQVHEDLRNFDSNLKHIQVETKPVLNSLLVAKYLTQKQVENGGFTLKNVKIGSGELQVKIKNMFEDEVCQDAGETMPTWKREMRKCRAMQMGRKRKMHEELMTVHGVEV